MDFPHHYQVNAKADNLSNVSLSSKGLETIESAPPAQFGGPGTLWSPESLLVAALADCFILTYRAIARASKLDWTQLSVEASGTLDRVERVTRFTSFTIVATLKTPAGVAEAKAQRLLQKAEQGCLISASVTAPVHLESSVLIDL